MYRKNKTLQWRNRQIYADYTAHLRNGMPVMLIYATIGHQYDLGEESIRKIIAEQVKK